MKEIYEALDWWIHAGHSNIPYENQYIIKTFDGDYVLDAEAVLEDVYDLLRNDFRTDRNGNLYSLKKCKYHCDYGDGEYCHYEGESGCVNIE